MEAIEAVVKSYNIHFDEVAIDDSVSSGLVKQLKVLSLNW